MLGVRFNKIMMIRSKPILIFVLIILWPDIGLSKSSDEFFSDEKIEKLMIGSWVLDPVDNPSLSSISTYKKDGSLDFVVYETSECEKVVSTTRANWKINNGNLIIIVIDSTVPNIFPSGLEVVDKVLYIDNKRKELIGTNNRLQKRIKSKKCLH